MPNIPNTENTPLLRTDFSDEAAWKQLVEAPTKPSDDGYLANLDIISDQEFEGAAPEALGHAAGVPIIRFYLLPTWDSRLGYHVVRSSHQGWA